MIKINADKMYIDRRIVGVTVPMTEASMPGPGHGSLVSRGGLVSRIGRF